MNHSCMPWRLSVMFQTQSRSEVEALDPFLTKLMAQAQVPTSLSDCIAHLID
ncbi:MAG TPA: hypothetical protein V6C90_11250 [Coleofasciculaceae cyanobacterium]